MSRVEGATTTHFHYDQDGRLIAESDGAVVREYLWLGEKPLGLVVGPTGSATLYFVHADHLDRVQKITDATQAIVWDGQFTPYGRTHAITGTIQNPLRFPGQWADPAANYFYNYMRDYDPTLARYLSVDPEGFKAGRNKYTYAGANPQNVIDPAGRAGQFVAACAIGAPAGGPIGCGAGVAVAAVVTIGVGIYALFDSSEPSLPELPAPAPKLYDIPSALDIPDLSKPLKIDPERACGGPLTRPDPLAAEHTKGKRPSTKEKHERGQANKAKSRGGERADEWRRPPRKPPPGHTGKWPPPKKAE